jgi:hypothetical protein
LRAFLSIDAALSHLHDVSLPDPELDLAGVGHHLDDVPVGALVTRLRHQRLEARPDLARAQVPGRSDELHPQRHGALAAIGQL